MITTVKGLVAGETVKAFHELKAQPFVQYRQQPPGAPIISGTADVTGVLTLDLPTRTPISLVRSRRVRDPDLQRDDGGDQPMSTVPFTIDGRDIPADAPKAQIADADAAQIAAAAQEFRTVAMHCHGDLTGRDLTLYAANAPDGPVAFTFGDGSSDVTEESVAGQASATHTYASDGVYPIGVYTPTDRWGTEVAVNWPPYEETP
jgi:hypothetical protein